MVRGAGPAEVILEEARSPYNHIVVSEQGSVRTMYFEVDGTHFIESRWDRDYPRSLDLDYTRTMMAGYVVHPKATKILMIGFGGGQISNYLFDRFPKIEIDAVDIDPEVIRLARAYFGVPESPRYRTHAADGRLFVEEADDRWDMIMLDAFRGVFVPYHLKTAEFYQALVAHLRPQGVVVANLHTGNAMYKHDRNTLADVFSYHYNFHTERGRQAVFVATNAERPIGAFEMRANAREVASHFDFDLLGLASRWQLLTDWDRGAAVLRDDFPPESLKAGAEHYNRRCESEDCSFEAK